MSEKTVGSIIRAVADAKGQEPANLTHTLEDYIATDAIRHLAEHDRDSWTIQFDLPNHTVTINREGEILVDGVQRRAFA